LETLYQQAAADMETPAPAEMPASETRQYSSDAPIGYEVGEQLADFTAECMDGSTFHLADTRGKVTFINLWATHCAPCKQELPYFNDLYKAHQDDIAMLIVHSSLVVYDVDEYLADKGYEMPFTIDTEDDEIWDLVGGSSTMPQTIVLNRNGEVIYNQTKSVTPEALEALYAQAAGEPVEAAPDSAVSAADSVSSSADDTLSAQPTGTLASQYVSSAPIGYEVGEQLSNFTAECMDGSTFHLANTRGRVTFINLWATHCAPCKQELPYFNDLYKAHRDDIAMLIVHSSLVVYDVDEYLADKGYEMPFTIDTEDDEIWDIVGGSSTMPQTIVLNRNGEVIYNQTRSVTPEALEALYTQAAAE
ncbi:MAG: TlpA family protein disulfide reductase, partial [Clostridia bacterium]|nr:TlpA family protein disulfide reductase [Clostridia bacterium]